MIISFFLPPFIGRFWEYFIDIFPDVALIVLALAGLGYLAPKFLKELENSQKLRVLLSLTFIMLGVGAVLINHKGRTEQNQKQKEIQDSVAEVKRQNETILESVTHEVPNLAVNNPVSSLKNKNRHSIREQKINADAEIRRRSKVLILLRNEYILSHDGLSAGLLAGIEQPPTTWINERLKALGESWRYEDGTQMPSVGNLKQRTVDLSNEIMLDLYKHGWRSEQSHPSLPRYFVIAPMPVDAKESQQWVLDRSGYFSYFVLPKVINIRNEFANLHSIDPELDGILEMHGVPQNIDEKFYIQGQPFHLRMPILPQEIEQISECLTKLAQPLK